MKPKRIHRPRGPNWQGDTTTLCQAKPTSHVPSSARSKPFAGKVFYLDLPSNRAAETLESDINELGGTVEKFFSKEIKYLVSNKREARYVQCLRQQDSPVPSPDSGQSSPHPHSNPHRPGSHGDNIRSRSQVQTDTFVTSRGKSLVEKVVKEQERVQMNKILSNALEWGVKILYVDDAMAYVQKRKKIVSSRLLFLILCKYLLKLKLTIYDIFFPGGRLSKPFVKVEDSSRHYRPICLSMPKMPEFNLKTVAPCSPFCVEDKLPPGNKQEGQRCGSVFSSSEDRALGRKKNKDKKRGGYCECCMFKYENLTSHLQSERHKAFSKSDEYLVVDRQVSTLHCNFIHIRAKVDSLDHVSLKDSSSSLFHDINAQKGSSKSLHFVTNQQEESNANEDVLPFEAVQDESFLPNKMTGNNLAENMKGEVPPQSFSPVRKIQRRIRVYKRKRRKVDTHVECVKPIDSPDNSMLKLWELFQSSDDMDVEFHGFEAYESK
uniref:Protein DBF4 homolog A n=1 Tax=Scophthalmus maximus TaxID=52904 RepID=A0A8D3DZZ9_SCOMX